MSSFDTVAQAAYDLTAHDYKFGRSKDESRYKDILYFPHHVSKSRKPMEPLKRASSFSPFAALTGFEAKINETGRTTTEEITLDESELTVLDRQLQFLTAHLNEHPPVEVTYFVPDSESHAGSKKSGGEYVTFEGIIKRIDLYGRRIIFCDEEGISQGIYSRPGKIIPIDKIVDIDGEIFVDAEEFFE